MSLIKAAEQRGSVFRSAGSGAPATQSAAASSSNFPPAHDVQDSTEFGPMDTTFSIAPWSSRRDVPGKRPLAEMFQDYEAPSTYSVGHWTHQSDEDAAMTAEQRNEEPAEQQLSSQPSANPDAATAMGVRMGTPPQEDIEHARTAWIRPSLCKTY